MTLDLVAVSCWSLLAVDVSDDAPHFLQFLLVLDFVV